MGGKKVTFTTIMLVKNYFPPISETPGGKTFFGGTSIKWGKKNIYDYHMIGKIHEFPTISLFLLPHLPLHFFKHAAKEKILSQNTYHMVGF